MDRRGLVIASIVAGVSVLLAGGVMTHSGASSYTPASQTIRLSAPASASIDQDTLISLSGNPTLSGTATNVSAVLILIYPNDPYQSDLYGVYGIFPGVADVHQGHWAFTVAGVSDTSGLTSLPSATYKVEIREYTGNAPPGSEGLAVLLAGRILVTGIL